MARALENAAGSPTETSDDPRPAKLRRLACRLRLCGTYPRLRYSAEACKLFIVESRCKSRLCPRCGRVRAGRCKGKLTWLLSKMDSPRFFTFTLKSSDAPLRDQITRLTAAFKELRRRELWKSATKGGAFAVEVTWNKKAQQWHPHLHVLADGSFIAQARLADAWEEITKDSRVVHVRAVHSRAAAAKYLTDYLQKAQDARNVPDNQLTDWALATHGLRFIQTFGTSHNIPLDEEDEPAQPAATELLPLDCLAKQSELGDTIAESLWRQTMALVFSKPPAFESQDLADYQTRVRSLVDGLRSWWSGTAANPNSWSRDAALARPPDDCVHQRPLWDRQDDHPVPSG